MIPAESSLPPELTNLPNWVGWREEVRPGSTRKTKVPYSLATGRNASSTTPADWIAYPSPEDVPDAYDGIGFVFTKEAGFTGIDLDDCLTDDGSPTLFRLKPWAEEVLAAFQPTYRETSPSGRGVKIWVKAELPGKGLKVYVDVDGNRTVESMGDGAIEMYDTGRYFTVTGRNFNPTGNALGALTVAPLQAETTALYARLRGNERPELPVSSTPSGKTFDIPAGAAISEGGRHEFLLSTAAKWRARGMELPELLDKLRELNALRCSPPKPEFMLKGIVDWFADKPPAYRPTKADYASAAQWATTPAVPGKITAMPSQTETDVSSETAVAVIPEPPQGAPTDSLTAAVAMAIQQGIESCYYPSLAREFAIAYLSGAESLIKANALKAKLKDHFKADLNLTRFSDGVRAIRDEIRVRRQPTGVPEGEIDLLRYGLNDQGNAERIRAVFGNDMRFCQDFKKWVIWDEQRWVVDGNGKARQMAKDVMRKFLNQAGSYDEEFAKFGSKSLNEKPLTAMLKMLESDLPVSPAELDRGPWLLNCLNGTVDLRTAEMLPHCRENYITKLVHFNYDPAADCPIWLRFLFSAMGDAEDASPAKVERAACMVSYIQRALGYSITGVTSEKAVFIPIGEFGNNGKSTMLDTVRRIIKEYSALLSVDTLMVRQESNNTQADLADLRGARFVQTSETEESQSLSQGKLKMLTAGMGTIKACRKFENPIEFEANFHIWLDTNKMPHVKDPDDTATLSRMHPIPFLVQITRIDQEMPNRLYAEAEGILAWMVAGAQDWYRNRLQRPEEVTQAREQWKSAQEDPWEQTVEAWIEKQNEEYFASSKQTYYTASISSILEGALGFKVKDMGQNRGEAIRLGRILKRSGWIVDKQEGVDRVRVYRKAYPESLVVAV